MEIRARQKNGVLIMDLFGKIDVNSANFVEAVGQCVHDGYVDILCNFEDIEAIDYMGISVVVIAYKEVINNKGRMRFVNVPVHVRNMLQVTGMDRIIEIFATEEQAVNSFKEDKIIADIKKMQLRRRFKRLPIDIKIEMWNKYDKTPDCVKVDILNLSAVGAYIYGCNKFKLGDEVMLKMKLPPSQEELLLEAVVVWLPDKQVQLHFYPGMGVEFNNISTSTQERLLGFIERNLPLMTSEE